MKKITIILFLLIIIFSCLGNKTGSLIIMANGEDFVTNGFTDKGNWEISFDKLLVNLSNIKVYSTDGKKAALKKQYICDLTQIDKEIGMIIIDKKEKIFPANYQGLKFAITKVSNGEFANHSIVMIGKAKKLNKVINFTIKLDEEVEWDCKDGYVGDEIKGIVKENGTGEVEMTFHFDHIFGDIEAGADDHVNTGAVGFEYFAQFAENGKIDISQDKLKEETGWVNYKKFIESIWGLGHSGEGHCEVVKTSSNF